MIFYSIFFVRPDSGYKNSSGISKLKTRKIPNPRDHDPPIQKIPRAENADPGDPGKIPNFGDSTKVRGSRKNPGNISKILGIRIKNIY